jgi:uncharacterized protein with PIN domain
MDIYIKTADEVNRCPQCNSELVNGYCPWCYDEEDEEED